MLLESSFPLLLYYSWSLKLDIFDHFLTNRWKIDDWQTDWRNWCSIEEELRAVTAVLGARSYYYPSAQQHILIYFLVYLALHFQLGIPASSLRSPCSVEDPTFGLRSSHSVCISHVQPFIPSLRWQKIMFEVVYFWRLYTQVVKCCGLGYSHCDRVRNLS